MEHIGGLLPLDFNLKRKYMILKKIFLAIFLFFLTIYIAYYLFRPVTDKEIKKFNDPDNWSNMGF